MSTGDIKIPISTDAVFSLQRHRKVVLVVDLVESVSLMQADELGVITRWQAFLTHVNQLVLPTYKGRLVKSQGDALMIEFNDVHWAAKSAQAMHDWMTESNQLDDSNSRSMLLRAGIHIAEVYADEKELYGNGVNIVSRVAALAGPNQTTITAEAREELIDGLDADFEDLGECYLKHVKGKVRVYRMGPPETSESSLPRATDDSHQPVIAVLPFEARQILEAQTLVGDLIADAVIHQLSRTELHVLSRLSSAAFKNKDVTSKLLEKHLGARYALSGTFHVVKQRILIGTELSDISTGTVIWAGRISARLNDLFDPESAIGATIATQVCGAIFQSRIKQVQHQPPEALDDYALLLGGITLMHRQSKDDFAKSRQLLEHLKERRPRFGAPRAWLGQWYAIGVSQGWLENPLKEAHRAMAEVERAFDRDPSLSLALTIKGQILGYLLKDFDAAEISYSMAIEENPNEALAWIFMATLNSWKGRGDEAKHCADKALLLSPLHPARYYYDSLAATAYLAFGDYKKSAELAERSLKSHRLHASTYKTLIAASALSGDCERSRQVATALMKVEPEFSIKKFIERSPMANSPQLTDIVKTMTAAGIPL